MYKSEYVGKNGVYAKVVVDSVAPSGARLTTIEVRFHRFILPEVLTHRMFSRNASSSRAIPVEKICEEVATNPAMPVHWGKNKPGMQANEENLVKDEYYEGYALFPYEGGVADCLMFWKNEAAYAAQNAMIMAQAGYHKQIVNRLTEPFQYTKMVITATEWDNFFKLRLHPDAQPEIQELARCMFEAMNTSKPNELISGEWHLPYVSELVGMDIGFLSAKDAIKASVARCARVSYMNHDNTKPDLLKDVRLHDILLEAGHMSPFEHQASPMQYSVAKMLTPQQSCEHTNVWEDGVTHIDRENCKWSGNFRAWNQYRNTL